ncbi:ABC transporter substrate-binding protein [Streptomyces sp. 8N616]|uniref:ABC transporter substrate-binding protein n=1 Tax=Streptomyces sp. 8N616 TaxID=3457414 RepID=UPI003FD360DA
MRRPLVGLAVATAVVFVLAGCGATGPSGSDSSSPGDDVAKVKVGVIPIVDVAPIYLGKTKGFFSRRGIDLTLESGQGGAAIVPGVVSGQFQFGFSNITSLMIARSKGVPLKAVASGNASTGKSGADFSGVAVKKNSPIKSAGDLAGHTVAVNTLQNIGDTTVRESVRKAGGNAKRIKFVELPFDQMPAALADGTVDAAWMVEPALSIAVSKGSRVVASNFVDTAPDLTVAAYFTSEKLIKENPDLVRRFKAAMTESLTYAAGHPGEVRKALATYTKIDPSLGKSLTLPVWPEKINRDSLATLAELGEKDGIFSKKPDLDALFS